MRSSSGHARHLGQHGSLVPVDLRVEGSREPLGIDGPYPVLSWRLSGDGRGRAQTAYRVLVARAGDPLDPAGVTMWDTGDVDSAETSQIPYEGAALTPRTRYHWRVRVADEAGQVSDWSEPAWFETGLINTEGWQAQWIGPPQQPASVGLPSLENVSRIWPGTSSGPTKAQVALFRTTFTVPSGSRPLFARLVIAGVARPEIYVNGEPTAGEALCGAFVCDVLDLLAPGENVLAVSANARAGEPGGLLARLEVLVEGQLNQPHMVNLASHAPVSVTTTGQWRAATEAQPGWEQPEFDDSAWRFAEELGLHADPPWGREPVADRPSPYLRREFGVSRPLRRARLYATALGVYELHLNGQRVGENRLAPGWTNYRTRIPYQTYDVTDLVITGDNVLSAVLADGWYAGNIGWLGPFHYGRRLALRAEVELTHTDGSVTRLGTDESWRVGHGAVRYADLQNGERHDARCEPEGWTRSTFDASEWPAAIVARGPHGRVVGQVGPPIRVQHEIPPQSVRSIRPGTWIIDFGQNLVGWTCLTVDGEAGRRVVVRHAEVLQPDGALYTANLRSARQTDEFVLRGGGPETLEPRFTVHGFRYAEVSGWPGKLDPSAMRARVAYADMERVGEFSCSGPLLNRLQQNIVWALRGNFLSVPTDCPQRDERLGWTGDAQVFASTAAFNMDVRPFFRKWLADVADAQCADGAITNVAPDVLAHQPRSARPAGSPGWGDAIAMVPWTLYRAYGDTRVATETYEPMRRWLWYLERASEGYVVPNHGFGDWLNLEAETPKDLVGTALFAITTRHVIELATVLGYLEDARQWADLYRRVRAAFRQRFVAEPGRLTSETQTAYVLAIHADLFDEHEVPCAAGHLVSDIEARGGHLSTGFLGTPYVLHVLSRTGHLDVAYRLLLQDKFPSWLYPLLHGEATTMWERWDGWTHHRGFQDPAMNSFNHYAYGAVGDWMYRTIAGIDTTSPGYRNLLIRPYPGGGLTWAGAGFAAPHGRIAVRWRYENEAFTLDTVVPPNTRAEVWIPTTHPEAVTESERPAATAEGVAFDRSETGHAVFCVGSGKYRFRAPLDQVHNGARQPCWPVEVDDGGG